MALFFSSNHKCTSLQCKHVSCCFWETEFYVGWLYCFCEILLEPVAWRIVCWLVSERSQHFDFVRYWLCCRLSWNLSAQIDFCIEFQWSPLCSFPIHLTKCHSSCSLSSWIGFSLGWALCFLVQLFASVLKMHCDSVKHCLLLLPWFKSICMDSLFKRKCSLLIPPPPLKKMTCDHLWLFCSCWSNMKYFLCSHFSDGNSKLTWQSDCAMWLLCLEVVRGRLSLGLGSVALFFFLMK